MISIRLRLLKWLIVPILMINLAGATLIYMLAWIPAQLAFDQGLQDAAGALAGRMRPEVAHGAAAIDLPRQAEQVLRSDAADAVYFMVRTDDWRLLAGDADFPATPAGPTAVAGVQQAYDDTMRGEPVRVAMRVVHSGGEVISIGVAKTVRKRQQLRAAIVRALVPLELLLTLALVGLIWFSVTNGLKPLARLRANLQGRDEGDLAPIDGAVPYELGALVAALNELLDKVRTGARAQHDFLADMAHQLRTPLAGVKLQLEWLGERHARDAETLHSLRLMLSSNERMIRQTNQLLALARAEPARFEKTRLEPVDMATLVEAVIQYFVDEAGKKAIDIGFELAPAPVAGDSFLLRDLIDNLIDNAVRYTPPHGTVTVRCRIEQLVSVLEIDDSGPGIAPESRASVFQRYARLDDTLPGSGLGLAIVRDIVHAHGATIALEGAPGGTGLRVSVRFPLLLPAA